MMDILDVPAFSAESTRNRRDFAKAQLIFWLMAATDGHAKNFSRFHEPGGIYRLTRFYGVLSAWPLLEPGPTQLACQKVALAMQVRSQHPHRKLMDIKPRHRQAVAKQAGPGDADNLINEVLGAVPRAAATVEAKVPGNFPARVRATIFRGIQQLARCRPRADAPLSAECRWLAPSRPQKDRDSRGSCSPLEPKRAPAPRPGRWRPTLQRPMRSIARSKSTTRYENTCAR